MPFFRESDKNKVLTYDGYRAMQKPRVIIFDGMEFDVSDCESLYISTGERSDAPVKRGFRVRCLGGRQFELELTEGDGWRIKPIPGPVAANEE